MATQKSLVNQEELNGKPEQTVVKVDSQKAKIRNLVSSFYDVQKLRISTGNRVVQSLNIQLGQAPSQKQEDMDEENLALIESFRKANKRITDAYIIAKKTDKYNVNIREGKTLEESIQKSRDSITDEIAQFIADAKEKGYLVSESGELEAADEKDKSAKNEVKSLNKKLEGLKAIQRALLLINTELDIKLIEQYESMQETEDNILKILTKEVEKHPMWDAFFKDVVGCGPLMSAVCIAYFDIDRARHVASFWRYAGLDTVDVERPKIIGMEDGKIIYSETETEHVREGRSMKHTEMVEYRAKDGTIKQKKGLTYNPTLKTKLLGVLGASFIKKPGCKYEQIYRDYMNRLMNREDADTITKLRKHRMANRYMIKQFVRDMWVTWRAMEGYEVSEPYEVAYLGRKPHKYNEYHERIAMETKRTAE